MSKTRLFNNTTSFEASYTAVRDAEQRLYTDEQVVSLPTIHPLHVHAQEWRIRKKSSTALVTYLEKKRKPLKILEIGCGNGWLSAKLASINGAEVLGLDANEIEIAQAKRVFKKANLTFIYGNFPLPILNKRQFDIILFAASLQYFPCITNVLNNCHELLLPSGEIHIVDTNFYTSTQIAQAAERSNCYYNEIGIPEMSNHYFHHSISDFMPFNYRIKTNPQHVWNRLFTKSPFYWIIIHYTSPR